MGGCASRPRGLKRGVQAPVPLDEPAVGSDLNPGGADEKQEVVQERAADGGHDEQGPPEVSLRQALRVLLKEMEAKEAEEAKVHLESADSKPKTGAVDSSDGVVGREEASTISGRADTSSPVLAAMEVA